MPSKHKRLQFSPTTLVLFSFLLLIAFGSILLKLEIATVDGNLSWIDTMFTATSAVCVTGLAVVDTGSFFTPFRQMVILVLIQTGGLEGDDHLRGSVVVDQPLRFHEKTFWPCRMSSPKRTVAMSVSWCAV